MEIYKVLHADGRVYHGGQGRWPLPNGDEPGDWLEVKGKLVACRHGLHICRPSDLSRWLGATVPRSTRLLLDVGPARCLICGSRWSP